MPLLTIVTNVSVAAENRQSLLSAASSTVSEMLGKPEKYVMVYLADGETLAFGGSSDPACLMQLKSLGLPEDQTRQFSSRLCDLADGHLGIEPNRTYIEFVNPPRHLWGFDRKTFQR